MRGVSEPPRPACALGRDRSGHFEPLRRLRILVALPLATLLLAGAGTAIAAQPCADAPPSPTVTVTGGPLPTDPSHVTSVPVGKFPGDLALDPRTGRVFVPVAGSDQVVAFDQYGGTAETGPTTAIKTGAGSAPNAVAVNASTGEVWVALGGSCRVALIDGRASPPTLVATADLAHSPSGIAVDPSSGRAFVSFAAAGTVGILMRSGNGVTEVPGSELTTGVGPVHLSFDPLRGWLFVCNEGPPGAAGATGQETLAVVATANQMLRKIGEVSLSVPISPVVDAKTGYLYVNENGDDDIAVVSLTSSGVPTVVNRIPSDTTIDAGRNRNPVGLAVLPGSGDLVVSQYGIGGGSDDTHHLLVFAPAGSGLTLMRTVAGVDKAVGLAVDPTTGRVWVSEREAGRVSAFTLDSISAKRLPPPLAEALPGPLDISWAPADVARSLGLTLLAMVLVGAPTPLFNHTLEGNLEEIRRMLRIDRISRRLRGRSAAWASVRAAISSSWFAFAAYLLAAAVLLSLVERGFPSPDGLAILAATTLSMLVVTGAVLATQRGFRLRRGTERGHVRVVAWVLLLALGCVMVTKVSGASPAYVYGIIGAYEFGVVLTATDRGRLALQTGLVLLALALTAWFVRIPFEPTIAHPATGMVALLNVILVKVFVAGIEGVVIGFIPVRFMSGEDLFRWRPWLWFAVWGGAVLLFMHVILYAPTDFEPNPDTTPLLTILATVAVYSVVAIGFWWFFAWRRRRAIADAESQA